jgi:chromosome partitioning protein
VRRIAVANQKGGSAKTTTTIHVGAGLAQAGRRVLLVDMDPQGHLAEGFGIAAGELDHEMSEVLDGKVALPTIIRGVRPGLDLAPSNIRLSIWRRCCSRSCSARAG